MPYLLVLLVVKKKKKIQRIRCNCTSENVIRIACSTNTNCGWYIFFFFNLGKTNKIRQLQYSTFWIKEKLPCRTNQPKRYGQ